MHLYASRYKLIITGHLEWSDLGCTYNIKLYLLFVLELRYSFFFRVDFLGIWCVEPSH